MKEMVMQTGGKQEATASVLLFFLISSTKFFHFTRFE